MLDITPGYYTVFEGRTIQYWSIFCITEVSPDSIRYYRLSDGNEYIHESMRAGLLPMIKLSLEEVILARIGEK
jgi:hypothetical protein